MDDLVAIREMHAWLNDAWIQAHEDSRSLIDGGPWRPQVVPHPG